MKTNVYQQLSHLHLEQRLWQKELELIDQEIKVFDMMLAISEDTQSASSADPRFRAFSDQLRHFRRVVVRVGEENQRFGHELRLAAEQNHRLSRDPMADYRYLRQEMDALHDGFRLFKHAIRTYLAGQEVGV